MGNGQDTPPTIVKMASRGTGGALHWHWGMRRGRMPVITVQRNGLFDVGFNQRNRLINALVQRLVAGVFTAQMAE